MQVTLEARPRPQRAPKAALNQSGVMTCRARWHPRMPGDVTRNTHLCRRGSLVGCCPAWETHVRRPELAPVSDGSSWRRAVARPPWLVQDGWSRPCPSSAASRRGATVQATIRHRLLTTGQVGEGILQWILSPCSLRPESRRFQEMMSRQDFSEYNSVVV